MLVAGSRNESPHFSPDSRITEVPLILFLFKVTTLTQCLFIFYIVYIYLNKFDQWLFQSIPGLQRHEGRLYVAFWQWGKSAHIYTYTTAKLKTYCYYWDIRYINDEGTSSIHYYCHSSFNTINGFTVHSLALLANFISAILPFFAHANWDVGSTHWGPRGVCILLKSTAAVMAEE